MSQRGLGWQAAETHSGKHKSLIPEMPILSIPANLPIPLRPEASVRPTRLSLLWSLCLSLVFPSPAKTDEAHLGSSHFLVTAPSRTLP